MPDRRRTGIQPEDAPMSLRSAAVAAVVICLAGCSHPVDSVAPRPEPTDHAGAATLPAHRGSLPRDERALATRIAKHQQAKVTGTFVGATAFATYGTPFDRGSTCDVDQRFVNVRLVWEADADFTHGGTPNGPPDGPRKAVLITVDPATGRVCETGARYREVGAADGETLLYGAWPDPADS
jgi:hypothetical protein